MHKLITVFLLLAYCTTVAQEASPWTLKKCIQYALEHNTSIAQNRLQGEIAENNLLQSKINRLPAINGNGNHNYNIGRTIDPFTNSFNNTTIQSNSFSIGAGVLLYGGSQVNHTINQNKSALLANQSSLAVHSESNCFIGFANISSDHPRRRKFKMGKYPIRNHAKSVKTS